jgi:RNA polymerase sigma-70 factor (ECF subfamily)
MAAAFVAAAVLFGAPPAAPPAPAVARPADARLVFVNDLPTAPAGRPLTSRSEPTEIDPVGEPSAAHPRTGTRRPVPDPELDRLSDEDLLSRFRRGQREVFGTLVRRYQRELYGYLRRYLGDPHLADDVFQDVTVLAMERAADIGDEQHLMLWARRAARLKILEALRLRARRTVALDDNVLDLLEEEWDGDAADSGEEIDHLRACMEKLSPHARTILGLRYGEEVSGARVAEVMQVKVQSVYVALARIHRALGDCIRQRRLGGGA